MSKYVIISDIHGNAPAIESVIKEEGSDSHYLILGDLMGLNSYPSETIDLIQSLDTKVVLAGNHDKAIFEYKEGHVNSDKLSEFEYSHTINNLSDTQIAYMQTLPYMDIIEKEGSRICATHAMPYPEKASGYEKGNAGIPKSNVLTIASTVADDYDYVFHGHTHQQYELDCSKFGHDVRFVNPGSVGYSGNYATIDTNSGDVKLKQVEVDDGKIMKHIDRVMSEDMPSVWSWY